MKTVKILELAALAVAAGLAGCRPGPGADGFVSRDADGLISLAVGRAVDLKEPVTDWRLTDDFEEIGAILPGDDPRTFLKTALFSYFDDQSVLAYSDDRVIRVSLKDGSFLCEYGHKGRGPGEYSQSLLVLSQDGEVYVNDLFSVCHVFSAESGKWLRDISLSGNGAMLNMYAPLGEGLGVVSYSSWDDKPQLFDIVDAAGRIIRRGPDSFKLKIEFEEQGKTVRASNVRALPAQRTGGYIYQHTWQEDTLYRISANKDTPWIYLDLAPYHSPYQKGTLQSDERSMSTTILVCGRFVFLTTSSSGGLRQIVYDLEGKDLLFCVSRKEGEEGEKTFGIPYERDGETRYLRPWMGDRELLICQDCVDIDNYYCFKLRKP